jgi:hypothetical protein
MASAATTELLTQDGIATVPGILPFKAHPLYTTWAPIWRKLAHIYDGAGGFLNGTYLVAHPREWLDYTSENPVKPTRKLKKRRQLARYENIGATIIDEKRASLFKQPPTRRTGEPNQKQPQGSEHPYLDWCEDVDGSGCDMDDFLKYAWTMAAIFGHVYLYMDRPASEEAPKSLAEQKNPILRIYTPLDVPDWLIDNNGELTAVKMVEPIQRTSLDEPMVTGVRYRSRYVDQENWWTSDEDNGFNAPKTPHNFGRLPVAVLYSGRKALQQVIGDSVLRDPKLFIDLYNLSSELRELLRNQTFGILNVQLGTGDQAVDVQTVKAWNGDTSGTENVFFSPGKADFIQPDASNVGAYQAERQYLLRTIYRLCVVHYESDTKDAKSADALKLETESFGQLLSSYADELEDTEYQIADLWFRATYGADAGPMKMDAANLSIRWPDEFDQATVQDSLKIVQQALAIDLGKTASANLKKTLVPQVLPDLPGDVAETIASEIEAQPDQAEQQQQVLEAAMSKSRLAKPQPKPQAA